MDKANDDDNKEGIELFLGSLSESCGSWFSYSFLKELDNCEMRDEKIYHSKELLLPLKKREIEDICIKMMEANPCSSHAYVRFVWDLSHSSTEPPVWQG